MEEALETNTLPIDYNYLLFQEVIDEAGISLDPFRKKILELLILPEPDNLNIDFLNKNLGEDFDRKKFKIFIWNISTRVFRILEISNVESNELKSFRSRVDYFLSLKNEIQIDEDNYDPVVKEEGVKRLKKKALTVREKETVKRYLEHFEIVIKKMPKIWIYSDLFRKGITKNSIECFLENQGYEERDIKSKIIAFLKDKKKDDLVTIFEGKKFITQEEKVRKRYLEHLEIVIKKMPEEWSYPDLSAYGITKNSIELSLENQGYDERDVKLKIIAFLKDNKKDDLVAIFEGKKFITQKEKIKRRYLEHFEIVIRKMPEEWIYSDLFGYGITKNSIDCFLENQGYEARDIKSKIIAFLKDNKKDDLAVILEAKKNITQEEKRTKKYLEHFEIVIKKMPKIWIYSDLLRKGITKNNIETFLINKGYEEGNIEAKIIQFLKDNKRDDLVLILERKALMLGS